MIVLAIAVLFFGAVSGDAGVMAVCLLFSAWCAGLEYYTRS